VTFSILSLASCSGAEETIGLLRQNLGTFSVDVPETWRRVNQENYGNTIPPETAVLYLNKIEGDDFIQNLNVVKESLNTDANSLEYAKANMLLGSKAIIDYRPVSREELMIGGISSVYHIFRARNLSTDPLRYYAQAYFVQDRIGYTVTCIAKDEDLVQQQTCEQVVKSFQFTS
jgi:hypothetical protein